LCSLCILLTSTYILERMTVDFFNGKTIGCIFYSLDTIYLISQIGE
jgi:hypothetical protein